MKKFIVLEHLSDSKRFVVRNSLNFSCDEKLFRVVASADTEDECILIVENGARTYRMYGLVPYNISPIQQGIQFGHAVIEYGLQYYQDVDYKKWSMFDKTFIILNGGTTNLKRDDYNAFTGTLNQHAEYLSSMGVKIAQFHEPDLGDQLTAVVFLVDDRVWNRELWPDITNDEVEWKEWKKNFSNDDEESDRIIKLREFLKNFKFA